MDLLDAILLATEGRDHIQKFREHKIEPGTLTLLSEDDLKIIGIKEEKVRNNILEHAKCLQIPKENKINLTVDKEYAQIVLNNINNNITRHLANLTCALTRNDTVICDVKLKDSTDVLDDSIYKLESQINKLEQIIMNKRKKSKGKSIKIVGALITASILSAMLIYRIYV